MEVSQFYWRLFGGRFNTNLGKPRATCRYFLRNFHLNKNNVHAHNCIYCITVCIYHFRWKPKRILAVSSNKKMNEAAAQKCLTALVGKAFPEEYILYRHVCICINMGSRWSVCVCVLLICQKFWCIFWRCGQSSSNYVSLPRKSPNTRNSPTVDCNKRTNNNNNIYMQTGICTGSEVSRSRW